MLSLSLERALDIMRIVPDPESKNYNKTLSTQQSTIATVLSTAARIDEARLRREQTDKLDELLSLVREAEAERTGPRPTTIDARAQAVPAKVLQ